MLDEFCGFLNGKVLEITRDVEHRSLRAQKTYLD